LLKGLCAQGVLTALPLGQRAHARQQANAVGVDQVDGGLWAGGLRGCQASQRREGRWRF